MMTYVETSKVHSDSNEAWRDREIRKLAMQLVNMIPIGKLKRMVEVTVRDPNNRKQFENDLERQRLDMLADRKEVEIIVKITI